MTSANENIDELQASLLRSLAAANRLRILHLLGTRCCEVNEVARELDMSQAAASQHLGVMRSVGLVEAVRDGRSVTYRLADPADPGRLRPHARRPRPPPVAAGRPGRRGPRTGSRRRR